jgi:hypothetical protein
MTVSLCVIMLEMVGVERVLPFLMVTIIVAKGVADRLGDSIILRRIKLKKLPFIRRMPHQSLKRARLTALDIVRMRDHPMLPECAPAMAAWCGSAHIRCAVRSCTQVVTAMRSFCSKATGRLIQKVLDQNPMKQVFVIVRPMDTTGQRTPRPGASLADDEEWVTQLATSSYSSLRQAALARSSARSASALPDVPAAQARLHVVHALMHMCLARCCNQGAVFERTWASFACEV